MKNITVSVPDEAYRQARIRAAERDTSVSALVAEFLRSLDGAQDDFERRRAMQQEITEKIRRFSAADRLERDQAHERALR